MYIDDVVPTYYNDSIVYGTTYYFSDRDYLNMYDKYSNQAGFHRLLIEFCRQQAQLGIDTHCIMGFNKLPTTFPSGYSVAEMIVRATAIGYGDGIRDVMSGVVFDYGRYLSAIVGDIRYMANTSTEFINNWYISYAAEWINSEYKDSLTNKKLSVTNTVQTFDDQTVLNLINLGVVTYKTSALNGLVISGGITQALPGSPWYLASNIKICQRCLTQLHLDLETYIANPSSPMPSNLALGDVVNTSLGKRQIEGIIKDYTYELSYDKLAGLTKITVDLYTEYTLEKITASTVLTS
jgi:hypothetical protein